MPYRLIIRKSGAEINYTAATEQAALDALEKLRGEVTISDSETGEILTRADLEDRLDERTPPSKGPKGEKLPADAIQRAVHIDRLAVGDIEQEDDGKDPNAKALGAKGGAARAKSLTAKKRSEIAKKAAAKRWEKSDR